MGNKNKIFSRKNIFLVCVLLFVGAGSSQTAHGTLAEMSKRSVPAPAIKIPMASFALPLYGLPTLFHLAGDSPFVSRLNDCQLQWTQKKWQSAFLCFLTLRQSLTNAAHVPASVSAATDALLAFFSLQLALGNIDKKKEDAVLPAEHMQRAKELFFALGKNAVFLNPDLHLFRQKISFFSGEHGVVSVSYARESLALTDWLSAIAPLVYLNAVRLNPESAGEFSKLQQALVSQLADAAIKPEPAKRVSSQPEPVSAVFFLAGKTAFDAGNPAQAETYFSFVNAGKNNFAESLPLVIFLQAETDYALKKSEKAEQNLTLFLQKSDSAQINPWAYLRMAELMTLKKKTSQAQILYEKIVRDFFYHPASAYAQVALFCRLESGLSLKLRRIEAEKVREKIKNAPLQLAEQGQACLLQAQLADLDQGEPSLSKQEKVNRQIGLIESYKNQFPASAFLPDFLERLRQLKQREDFLAASEKSCKEMTQFHSTRPDWWLSSDWDGEKQERLLRCSALLQNVALWRLAGQSSFDGQENRLVRRAAYDLLVSPSASSIAAAYGFVRPTLVDWSRLLEKTKIAEQELLEFPDFWQIFLVSRLSDLGMQAGFADVLTKLVMQDVLARPQTVWSSRFLCLFALRAGHTLTSSDWDGFVKTKGLQEWIRLLSTEDSAKTAECPMVLARLAFTESLQGKPSAFRDKTLVLPYLEHVGVTTHAEDWFLFADRLARQKNLSPAEKSAVQRVYARLAKDSGDGIIKGIASEWLEKEQTMDVRP